MVRIAIASPTRPTEVSGLQARLDLADEQVMPVVRDLEHELVDLLLREIERATNPSHLTLDLTELVVDDLGDVGHHQALRCRCGVGHVLGSTHVIIVMHSALLAAQSSLSVFIIAYFKILSI